ncbi:MULTISPECIES: hypothetical protein [Nocardia]|uniref:hypothetical protein n=2 Tax=Nocardia TaxID=1817 RepID=UPI00189465C3|nr:MULTISPECIES: hypothetical protein [Nocardia]MBF6177315.1 hypothetical protein [Nocardia otitidiscaviarum]
MTAMFKTIDVKLIAGELVLTLAILTAGYSIPDFDNPFQCVPHLGDTTEFLACLDR